MPWLIDRRYANIVSAYLHVGSQSVEGLLCHNMLARDDT